MPGLHLSLGIFNRLFELLEDACHELDVRLATRGTATGAGGDSFQKYAVMLKQLSELKEQHSAETAKQTFQSQLLSYLLVTVPAPQHSRTVQSVREELVLSGQKISALVNKSIHCSNQHNNIYNSP